MQGKRRERPNQGLIHSRSPYFAFYADDWIAGTIGLTFEQKGFYIGVLAAMWSRRAPIPFDQLPMALGCDPRPAARLLSQLIDLGKLHLDADNRVYNSRLMGLLKTGFEQSTSAKLPADFRQTSPELPAEVQEKSGNIFPEKPTKSTKPRARARLPYPEPEPEKKESIPLASSESGAASGPDVVGLNGSSATIIGGVARWLNAHVPDIETARRCVTGNVGIYGADAVRRGYADLETDILDGKLVGSPLKAFTAYCDRAKRRQSADTTHGASHGIDRQAPEDRGRSLNKHERLYRAITESNRQLGIGTQS